MNHKRLTLLLILLITYSCSTNSNETPEPKLLPILKTSEITIVDLNSIIAQGNIIDNQGLDITESGFCWSSTNETPTIEDFNSVAETNDEFNSSITNLIPDTSYFIRAYAKNDDGIGYGDVKSFKTLDNNPPLTFSNVKFGFLPNRNGTGYKHYEFFSTNGSMSQPVTIEEANTVVESIDISFLNATYLYIGFADPVYRGEALYGTYASYYWGLDYMLGANFKNAVKTKFYRTEASEKDFLLSKIDEAKIDEIFNRGTTRISTHATLPIGSVIGGLEYRVYQGFPDPYFQEKLVIGFKNEKTGKKGLIYIREDQITDWQDAMKIRVDIIREK